MGMTLDVLAKATGISKPYLSNLETARAPGPPSEEKLRKLARALAAIGGGVVGGGGLVAGAGVNSASAGGGGAGGGGGGFRGPPDGSRGAWWGAGGAEEMDSARPRRADGTVDLDAMMGKGAGAGGGVEYPPAVAGGPGRGGAGGGLGGGAGVIPVRAVPLINRVAAGAATEFGDLSYPAGVADAYVPLRPDLPEALPVGSAFAVRVIGDSMMPEYREGEILIVGPGGGEAKDGDDCVVRLGELEQFATTFKRVFFVEEGVRLVPLNSAHAERVVPLERVTGIYPVMYRVMPAGRGR